MADLAQASEASREGFFKLGISQQAQNEAMAGYMKLQARTGNAEKQTTDQLAASARNYITEQDQLARITGMNVKDQQKVREAALMEEQFLAKVRQLQREGKHQEAKELQDANVIMSAMGDEVGKGFRAMVNGNLRDENARKLQFSSMGAGLEATQQLTSGQISAAEASQKIAKGIGQGLETMADQQAQLGTAGQFGINYSQQVRAQAFSAEDATKALEKAQADQAKTLAGKGDPLADAQGRMIKVQQDINKKLEDDVFKGIPNAQAAMGKLANVTDGLADVFTKLTNAIVGVLNFFGLGEKKPEPVKQMTAGEKAAVAATQGARDSAKPLQDRVDQLNKEIEQDEKKLKDAKRAGKYGKEEQDLEQKILKNKKEHEEEVNKLVEVEKKISQLGKEEHHLRVKQQADRQTLRKLENQNLKDTEEIKVQNEKKINAQKAGDTKGVASAEAEIKNRQSSIQGRSEQVSKLQTDLKTSPVSSGGKNPTGAAALADAGIKVKKGDVQKEGADLSPKIIEMAKAIQSGVPGFAYFSGFNDNFHQEKASSSNHTKGLAADFALEKKPSPEDGAKVVSYLKDQGASLAIDEYNSPTAKATGGHFHVEIPTFADGGDLAAGKLGIAGEAGPEFVQGPASITPMGDITGVFNNMAMMIGQQTGAIEELIRLTKNSNDIQTKILRVQQ